LDGRSLSKSKVNFFYYEVIKREINRRLIYECRCDERLKATAEGSTRLGYTGLRGGLEDQSIETRLIQRTDVCEEEKRKKKGIPEMWKQRQKKELPEKWNMKARTNWSLKACDLKYESTCFHISKHMFCETSLYWEWEEDDCPAICQKFLWSRPSPCGFPHFSFFFSFFLKCNREYEGIPEASQVRYITSGPLPEQPCGKLSTDHTICRRGMCLFSCFPSAFTN